jgi:hypothetical protein
MNYAEEISYWYLRLNGFFPLSNFVIHRHDDRRRRSDCDVLAIRHPHVYEQIGGRPSDWDKKLQEHFDFTKILGVIVEVKTADIGEVFRHENVGFAIDRLGFIDNNDILKSALKENAVYSFGDLFQVGKLLIANEHDDENNFIFISLIEVRNFIKRRIKKYLPIKYSDRFFFKSTLLQEIIWEVKLERR